MVADGSTAKITVRGAPQNQVLFVVDFLHSASGTVQICTDESDF